MAVVLLLPPGWTSDEHAPFQIKWAQRSVRTRSFRARFFVCVGCLLLLCSQLWRERRTGTGTILSRPGQGSLRFRHFTPHEPRHTTPIPFWRRAPGLRQRTEWPAAQFGSIDFFLEAPLASRALPSSGALFFTLGRGSSYRRSIDPCAACMRPGRRAASLFALVLCGAAAALNRPRKGPATGPWNDSVGAATRSGPNDPRRAYVTGGRAGGRPSSPTQGLRAGRPMAGGGGPCRSGRPAIDRERRQPGSGGRAVDRLGSPSVLDGCRPAGAAVPSNDDDGLGRSIDPMIHTTTHACLHTPFPNSTPPTLYNTQSLPPRSQQTAAPLFRLLDDASQAKKTY